MGTMPGAVVMPQHYADYMILYSATDRVEAVVDGAPAGPNGRLYIVEPGKAQKVPYEAGRFILDHLGYTGVVRVQETETDTGITFDIETAKQASLNKSKDADEKRFKDYISAAVEDYVKQSKPVPPPSDAILRVIERRGYDLKRFGIVPIGWEEPEKDARVQQLEDQLKALQAQIANLPAAEEAPKKKGR